MKIYKLIEQKQKIKGNGKVAKMATLTAIVGTAIGVITGIIMAPKSGKDTRNDIKNKANEVKDNVKEVTVIVKDTINTKVPSSKNNIKVTKAMIKQYISSKKKSGEEITNSEDIKSIENNEE